MIELATATGRTSSACRSYPSGSLERLDEWSGMQAFGAVAARPLLGAPSSAA
jgi:hypothetical protein